MNLYGIENKKMQLIKTSIPGPLIVKTEIHKDKRGFFLKETYQKRIFGNKDFPFDIMSSSKKNVLRGLHLQIKKTASQIYYCNSWENTRCHC